MPNVGRLLFTGIGRHWPIRATLGHLDIPQAARWVIGAASILMTAAILYVTAPVGGDFHYSDAPRHALNGAFILDLVRAHPTADPVGWAASYYIKYPALTILFYPPLFHAVEAVMFALFGVSHPVAQLTVSLFSVIGAAAAYYIARRFVPPATAVAAAILFLSMPVAAFWGRQVMLDVPATAIMLCAMAALLRYTDKLRARWLYAATALLVAALYIKQPIVFVGVPFAWILWRKGLLFRRATLWAAAGAGVGLIPLAFITFKFGQFNAVSVTESAGQSEVSPLLYYVAALPSQLGWPLLGVMILAIPLAFIVQRRRLPETLGSAFLIWIGVGFIFFTAIGLKSERFDLPILFPLVVLTLWSLHQLPFPAWLASAGSLALAAVTLLYALAFAPIPTVGGYDAAANEVAARAAPASAVLFSGKRDGSFIFNMRALASSRNDINIIRSDKLFFEMAVSPRYGVKTLRDFTQGQILALLEALDIEYVVAQDNFMMEQPVMQRLQDVLHSTDFQVVRRIPVKATVFGAEDTLINIYRRTTSPTSASVSDLEISLPIIGRKLTLTKRQAIEAVPAP